MMTPDKHTLIEPIKENRFTFSCYKGIQCFTECCAGLNLVLTPYDILRIKNRLGISSGSFLEKYTDPEMENQSRFPMLKLRMNQDEKKSCPFVSPEGCTIYEDRPGACRIYPLGRAAKKPGSQKDVLEHFFIVKEDHCLGFYEDKEWTVDEWMKHEGIREYNAMNDRWLEIITSQRSLGPEKDHYRKIQMFLMASYNLDRFRDFVFESKFFDLFHVEQDVKERLSGDDVALIKFSFDWLKFSLFGDKTMQFKD